MTSFFFCLRTHVLARKHVAESCTYPRAYSIWDAELSKVREEHHRARRLPSRYSSGPYRCGRQAVADSPLWYPVFAMKRQRFAGLTELFEVARGLSAGPARR